MSPFDVTTTFDHNISSASMKWLTKNTRQLLRIMFNRSVNDVVDNDVYLTDLMIEK